MNKKTITKILVITVALLMIPLVAMQFTDEVQWEISDFVIMGTLMIGTGLSYEWVASKSKPQYRIAIGFGFLVAFLLLWAELAVGIFGSPFAGS